MNWIHSNSAVWYRDHDWHFGGKWHEPKDYPAGLEPEINELGAIIADDGTVKNRIRLICRTTTDAKSSLATQKHWQT